jgi:drug/metabolite transporter (DMT)-like permease
LTERTKAETALLALTLIWGGTFSIVKIGMREIAPVTLIAIRFLVAGACILALFWRKIFPLTSQQVVKGCIVGLLLFLGFVPQNIGLTMTTASKSAFITGMMVVFVPLLQFIVERRAPKVGNIAGVMLVGVGLWFLTSPTGSEFNGGDALTLLCAVFFAIYIVYLDVVSREMSALQLTFLQLTSVAAFSCVAVLLFETPRVSGSATVIGCLLYLTFLATLLTTFVQTRVQKLTTPTRAAIIFSVEPVFASIIAYALLDEKLGELGILGGVMIVGGVLLSELSDGIPFLRRTIGAAEP